MEDYHFAEYRRKRDHVLGLFAIFDGHLGDRVPSYLKENLFNNILEEVCMFCLSVCSFLDHALLMLEHFGLRFCGVGFCVSWVSTVAWIYAFNKLMLCTEKRSAESVWRASQIM